MRDTSFTGVTVEECRVLLSGMDSQDHNSFHSLQAEVKMSQRTTIAFVISFYSKGSMQQNMDDEKKGLWKTLMEKFSSKPPEDVQEKTSEK